jgi:hypothetical protein
MFIHLRRTLVIGHGRAEWRNVLELGPGNDDRQSRSGRQRWLGKHVHVHGIGPKPRPWLTPADAAALRAAGVPVPASRIAS